MPIILSLLMMFVITACAPDGTIRGVGDFSGLGGWGVNNTQNKPDPKPIQRDSEFDQRLEQITQSLDNDIEAVETAVAQSSFGADERVIGLTNNDQKIALIVPLSGPQAGLGQSMLVAGQLALQDINPGNVTLLPKDSGTTVQTAQKSVNEALVENVDLILGPVFANQVAAVKDSANRSDTPLVGFTTDWNVASGQTYVMGFLPFQQVTRIVDYARAQGARELLVVAPNNDYGRVIIDTAKSYNALPTQALIAAQGDTAGTIAAKILQNMDQKTALLFAYDGNAVGDIVSALATANASPQNILMLGTGILDDPALINDSRIQGIFFASAPVARRIAFEERYISLANQKPQRLASLAYDAVALAAVLAQGAGEEKFGPAQMRNPNGFSGVDGVFRFKDSGQVERNLSVLTWRNGVLSEVDPAQTRF